MINRTQSDVQALSIQERILSRFEFNLPLRPYCTNNKESGIWYTSKEQALLCKYIQPNFGIHCYIPLDIDSDNVWWYDYDLPEPTMRIITPGTGRSHWLYKLQRPVFTWSKAKAKPREFLDFITCAMTIQAIAADEQYRWLLIKNPYHKHWRVETYDNRYTLAELDEHIRRDTRAELKIRRKQRDKAEYSSLGRNCFLFDCGRYYAYPIAYQHNSIESLYQDVLEQINYQNAFTFPRNLLPQRECEQIAWSIAKWTYPRRHNFSKGRKTKDDEDLRQRQKKSAEATNQKQREESAGNIRKAIAELEAEDRKVTADQISEKTELNRATVYRSEAWKSYKSEIQKK